ncbi:DUF6783 domain-containing protein [uncultured Robinsoniella sp.]|uniref:DUF6783 domain-containing protein n=1 Tax=uncultured Robinsoniella sp. TaxID=904190 RepID=UPI00374F8364
MGLNWKSRKRLPANTIKTIKSVRERPVHILSRHSSHLHTPLRGILAPNSGYIARYVLFIWYLSLAKCGAVVINLF